MQLSVKHKNQQNMVYSDFTGGLNTTTVPEMIADNQMAECVNMEFNRTTGALQTCCGTATVFTVPDNITISNLWYDEINNVFIFTDSERNVYRSQLVDIKGTHGYDRTKVGELTGTMPPSAVMWEDGLIIASGGRLQYWNGSTLRTLKTDLYVDSLSYSWRKLGSDFKSYRSFIKYYFKDNIIHESNKYYRCEKPHAPASTFGSDKSNWVELTVNSKFECDKTYTAGVDVVIDDGIFYLCDETHLSMSEAPAYCDGVFIKNGRVYTWHEYTLRCSGVGNESNWTEDSGDDSSSKWIDIGYKEGENGSAFIAGACALSSDIVIVKNDGKIYRLSGDFPDWSLKEIARGITCLNPQCYIGVQDGIFLVGREGMFFLQTTVDYGDIRPTNVANGVMSLLGVLSVEKTFVRFMPTLNQIWVAGCDNKFVCYDMTFKTFFLRKFNSDVYDICQYKNNYMLTRKHSVTELTQGIYQDEKYSANESDMEWSLVVKSHTSFYDFLLRRIRLTYVPLLDDFDSAWLITANGKIKIAIHSSENKQMPIQNDTRLIYSDDSYIYPTQTQFVTEWMVYRKNIIGIRLEGKGSAIMINKIEAAISEV